MEEPFGRVLSGPLLREIIGYLPYEDELRMREVDKNWAEESSYVLKSNRLHRINFDIRAKLLDFIFEFYDTTIPMQLLPLAKVIFKLGSLDPKRLTDFAIRYGRNVRVVKLLVPMDEELSMDRLEHQCKVMLQHFVNLEKLSIRPDEDDTAVSSSTNTTNQYRPCTVFIGYPKKYYPYWSSKDDTVPAGTEVINLPTFENLQKFSMNFTSSRVDFFNELMDKIPPRTCANIVLKDDGIDVAEPNPFAKLKLLRLHKLHLFLKVNNVQLVKQLTNLELCTSQLFLMRRDPVIMRDEMSEEFMPCVEQFLINTQVLTKLHMAMCNRPNTYELNLPHMRTIQMLTLEGDMCLSSSTQFTSLHSLEYKCKNNPFSPDVIFPCVKNLVLSRYWSIGEDDESVALLESMQWTTKFPCLTVLNIVIVGGADRALTIIFRSLVNLEQLTLVFRDSTPSIHIGFGRDDDPDLYWDMVTGGIEPRMDHQTPLEFIIPDLQSSQNGNMSAQAPPNTNNALQPDEIITAAPAMLPTQNVSAQVSLDVNVPAQNPFAPTPAHGSPDVNVPAQNPFAPTSAQVSADVNVAAQNPLTPTSTNRNETSQPSVPSLYSLHRLKVLDMKNAPPSLLYAVVHLTASRKMWPLYKLKYSSNVPFQHDQSAHDAYVNVLEYMHDVVKLSAHDSDAEYSDDFFD